MMRVFLLCLIPALAFSAASNDPRPLIRANDLAALRAWISSGALERKIDERGNQPLHYAALYGSPEAVEMLLKAGALPDARNADGVTPLIYAARQLPKVELLLAAGADAKAVSDRRRTALHSAVRSIDGLAIARLLVAQGADVNAVDVRGETPLIIANALNVELIRFLLTKGAKAKVAGGVGYTPAMNAAAPACVESLDALIAAGADLNAETSLEGSNAVGPLAIAKRTPLLLAAQGDSPEAVRKLLRSGASPKHRDVRGVTPLLVSVAGDHQNPEIVRTLIEAGSDVNARDNGGESVLDWARKNPNPAVIRLLEKAGAQAGTPPSSAPKPSGAMAESPLAEALGKAMRLIEGSEPVYWKKAQCMACHHQPAAGLAVGALREAGLPFDPAAAAARTKVLVSSRAAENLEGMESGGRQDGAMFALMGAMAQGVPPSESTDALVLFLLSAQTADGAWRVRTVSHRPPVQASDIQRTAYAVKILQHYGWPARKTEFDAVIARAKAWLEKAQPLVAYEEAELLLGLTYTGSAKANTVQRRVIALQKPNGGWAQTAHLSPDPYATALALHALRTAGMAVTHPVYTKGIAYLRRTQLDDGSWYVASRTLKFQPYFESAFPHGHDQWISIIATAYAVRALAPAAH